MSSKKDLGRIYEKSLISTFLMLTIFVKTLRTHNILLLFCSSRTEGKPKNVGKAILIFLWVEVRLYNYWFYLLLSPNKLC